MVHSMQVKKLEQELINSLEKNILRPGKIVSAKVLKAENGLYLLSLNGEKVQAKSEKPLNSQATNFNFEFDKFLHSSNQVVLKKSHLSKSHLSKKFEFEKFTFSNVFL